MVVASQWILILAFDQRFDGALAVAQHAGGLAQRGRFDVSVYLENTLFETADVVFYQNEAPVFGR
ncbi:MAG: hypothetical protein AAGF12_43950, partial [Myxococcota bacterium]